MPRVASTLLLALLVVFAQQAALMHAISHEGSRVMHGSVAAYADGGSQTSADAPNGAPETNSFCDKCFQFAHVAGYASAPAAVLPLLAHAAETVHSGQAADLAAQAPQSRSRGPPVFL